MKVFNYIQKHIYGLDKRKIFLLGFYLSFLFVMTLAMILDMSIENYVDAYVEMFFIVLTLFSILYYQYNTNIDIAIYSIVIIATLTTYALLVSNNYNISVFHSIVPLGYFLLFSLKRSLLYTVIHQCIVIAIYGYGYYAYPEHPFLHDMAMIVATMMASLMIILFGIVYHLAVENSYHLLEKSNRQKEILLKEIHHRVKNNLNIVSSMLGLQMLREDDEKIKYIFEKNKSRIHSIALVHEILYKHQDFEKINIYDYLNQLSFALVQTQDTEMKVHIDTYKKTYLSFDLVLKLGIITNELIVNSMKYAFHEKRLEIYIHLEEEEEFYIYSYKDNDSRYIDIENLQKKESLGLKLVEMMVEQMETTLVVDNHSGLNYTIKVPKNVC
ncbi:MAG: Signal Transduction Histidine Kinase [uncultured Sulfurovum sp.]|uniref:histidine kinase n=1 Tax=uncultured Sulfurovum sp. TaxID=269237 RepID=A0A6S6TXL0_9BACT|nr:MAG: Signal Transduction Histidine Kinase [uncultured Sulfurovum sp.]